MRAEYAHCLNLTIIDEEKFRPHIGFFGLRDYLESELQKRYKEAAPATIALLEQRCNEVTDELAKMDSKIQATYDVAHLRRSAMLHTTLICNDVGALIDGAVDPAPEQGGNNKRGTVRECYLEQAWHFSSGGRGVTEAAAEIARTAAQSWLAPLLDTACDRLAFVLGSLVDLAVERSYSGGRGVTEVEELQKQWG
ncbi:hypothetical protein U1Q18_029109 [Sarracenia purpurea var. burkii]